MSSETLLDTELCWSTSSLTRADVYRILVVAFAVCMCPLLFFHMTRSRWLQLLTTVLRWITFLLMFVLAVLRAVRLRYSQTELPVPNPRLADQHGLINLFGFGIYVCMCHHSIPGMVTPIRDKSRLQLRLFVPVFIAAIASNLLLSGTSVIAFLQVKDLYTLNFIPTEENIAISGLPDWLFKIFGYFIPLFPVFALSSTFPILAITLLGTLKTLCSMCQATHSPTTAKVLNYVLPFVVLLPPICIALGTDNLGYLLGITGAIAGSGIQYIIPATLAYTARRRLEEAWKAKDCGQETEFVQYNTNFKTSVTRFGSKCLDFLKFRSKIAHLSPYASPFQHNVWIVLLLAWSVVCIVLGLIDKIHPM